MKPYDDQTKEGIANFNTVENQMKKWMSELSQNDIQCEQKIRTLIKKDKKLTSEIKDSYNKGNTPLVKSLIKEFLSSKKKGVRACKNCGKVNLINFDKIETSKCGKCKQLLLGKTNNEESENEFLVSDNDKRKNRKCHYCGKEIQAYSLSCSHCQNDTVHHW
ncbi:hypothetical protein [Planococcus faecalis]|uniref:hypothetical protein n=1 Tax=Planococcus faecalis TaxID=1598147 RepID=UPI0008DA87FF|nr:hypothetical protein [Planococcus faecalis]OHX51661.1 hypothetical protein BB777_15935 [Planococcus faecalis]